MANKERSIQELQNELGINSLQHIPESNVQKTTNEKCLEAWKEHKQKFGYVKIQDCLDTMDQEDLSSDILNFFKAEFKKSPEQLKKLIAKYQDKSKVGNILNEVPKDGEHFIELYCKAYGIQLLKNGMYKRVGPLQIVNDETGEIDVYHREDLNKLLESKDPKDLSAATQLKIRYDQEFTMAVFLAEMKMFISTYKNLNISRVDIDDGFTIWYNKQRKKMQQELYATVEYKKNDPATMYNQMINEWLDGTRIPMEPDTSGVLQPVSNAKLWLTLNKPQPQLTYDQLWDAMIYLITDDESDITKAVLQHFIWQVKRKLAGLEVSYHMMPVIVGGQGHGKSKFLDKFLSPVGYESTDFIKVADPSAIGLFEDNWILFLDEMHGANKQDINYVKGLISSDIRSTRKFHSQTNLNFKQNATFIGASNNPLGEVIRDNTGMRRFYQINFKKIEEDNYDIINHQLNYQRLWQSVNEFGPSPTLIYKDRLNEIQEEYRDISPLEDWLNSLQDNKMFTFNHTYKVQDLYNLFKEHDKHNDRGWTTKTSFGKLMRKEYKGFKIHPHRTAECWTYKITKE